MVAVDLDRHEAAAGRQLRRHPRRGVADVAADLDDERRGVAEARGDAAEHGVEGQALLLGAQLQVQVLLPAEGLDREAHRGRVARRRPGEHVLQDADLLVVVPLAENTACCSRLLHAFAPHSWPPPERLRNQRGGDAVASFEPSLGPQQRRDSIRQTRLRLQLETFDGSRPMTQLQGTDHVLVAGGSAKPVRGCGLRHVRPQVQLRLNVACDLTARKPAAVRIATDVDVFRQHALQQLESRRPLSRLVQGVDDHGQARHALGVIQVRRIDARHLRAYGGPKAAVLLAQARHGPKQHGEVPVVEGPEAPLERLLARLPHEFRVRHPEAGERPSEVGDVLDVEAPQGT
mmetsp:Transcript_129416/g.414806  ORF Transcript_129416/g.414806 Transcript_129416/m.414806 type:complete len:346 (+) Transcript_129416:688-1725(+)